MAKFSPALLVPASQIEGFAKTGTQRSVTQVAIDNINKMKEQWAAGDAAEGRKTYKAVGDKVAFTIRVNNTALVLERTKVQETDVEVREMAVPAEHFLAALDFYADRIKGGEYDDQLLALEASREQRTTKLRATRAEKKEVKAA